MGLWNRFVKLCQADLHGALDRIEDPSLLLQQHLRDMAEALENKEKSYRTLIQSHADIRRDLETTDQELGKLESDLALALNRDRDDLARGLISRRLGLSRHRAELARHLERLDQEGATLRELIDRQRLIHEDLRLRAAEYLRERERPAWSSPAMMVADRDPAAEIRADEVEFELLRAKAAMKGGS